MINDREPLQLSGIQHFAFCRRQWALIHIEQQWSGNVRTTEGDLLHRRAHDGPEIESRGDTLIMRGLRVASRSLNVTGICDVVEFTNSPDGISLYGRDGLWRAYPVEYKRGEPKEHDADELQLCCQAMCLEEMLLCEIPEGSLYYSETRRRLRVALTEDMRSRVRDMLTEMQGYYDRGYTPKANPTKACAACSLNEICLPRLKKLTGVGDYISRHAKEESQCESS